METEKAEVQMSAHALLHLPTLQRVLANVKTSNHLNAP